MSMNYWADLPWNPGFFQISARFSIFLLFYIDDHCTSRWTKTVLSRGFSTTGEVKMRNKGNVAAVPLLTPARDTYLELDFLLSNYG